MDKAMMMHVVIDKQHGQPVCGNWLFFGFNKEKPKEIYVVANFFEIRAGYGLKNQLRDELVKQLLLFTGEYAEKINAKGFIIRPLTYGLIPDFKDIFPKKEISIDKVGGYFSPFSYDCGSKELYYLDAVNLTSFYEFYPGRLLRNDNQSAINIETVKHTMWSIDSGTQTSDGTGKDSAHARSRVEWSGITPTLVGISDFQ